MLKKWNDEIEFKEGKDGFILIVEKEKYKFSIEVLIEKFIETGDFTVDYDNKEYSKEIEEDAIEIISSLIEQIISK